MAASCVQYRDACLLSSTSVRYYIGACGTPFGGRRSLQCATADDEPPSHFISGSMPTQCARGLCVDSDLTCGLRGTDRGGEGTQKQDPQTVTGRAVLKGKQKRTVTPTDTNVHREGPLFGHGTFSKSKVCGWWLVAVGGWRLAVGGNWRAVGGWRLVGVGGWQLAVGGSWRAVGGWRLVVGGWWRLAFDGWWLVAIGGRLVVGGWWRLAVGSGCRLAVGGPWGLSLRAVLSKKNKHLTS